MTEVTSGPNPTEPVEKPIDLARVAAGYFKRASVDCPASVHAQGARIAQLARTEERNIPELRDKLVQNQEALLDIQQAANKAHSKSGNPKAPSPTLDRVRSTVLSSFDTAIGYERLSDPQLTYIAGELYQESIGTHDPDEFMAERVFYILSAAKKAA